MLDSKKLELVSRPLPMPLLLPLIDVKGAKPSRKLIRPSAATAMSRMNPRFLVPPPAAG